MIKNVLRAILVLTLLLASACDDPPPWTEDPQGFVEVQSPRFVYKAVAPDGASIGVRRRPNDEKGDLAFWSEVFQREMADGKGYRVLDKSAVTSNDGVKGTLMRYEVADEQTPYHYQIALFVTEGSIVSVEAACPLDKAEQHRAAFDAALASLNATRDDELEKD